MRTRCCHARRPRLVFGCSSAVAVPGVWAAPAAGPCAPTPGRTGSGAPINWQWLRPHAIEAPAAPARHQNQRPGGGSRAHHGHLQPYHRRLRAALGRAPRKWPALPYWPLTSRPPPLMPPSDPLQRPRWPIRYSVGGESRARSGVGRGPSMGPSDQHCHSSPLFVSSAMHAAAKPATSCS
jgi:hypothetical protein